jgi:hypothetical protein
MTKERQTVLAGAVKECVFYPELLEEAFKLYGISDDADAKSSVLVKAMGDPTVGYCGNPTSEEKYETLRNIFLSGTWQENDGRSN